jgi:hypothetical protein
MPFEMKSNHLENNALFAGTSEPQPKAEPKKKTRTKKKSEPETKKQAPEIQNAVQTDTASEAKKPSHAKEKNGDLYTRATFIVRRDLLKQLKDYAYTERREIKDVINEILEQSLAEISAEYDKKGITLLEKK